MKRESSQAVKIDWLAKCEDEKLKVLKEQAAEIELHSCYIMSFTKDG